MDPLTIAAITGGIGAVAGSKKNVTSLSSGITLGAESELEKQAGSAQLSQFQDLLKLLGGQNNVDQIQGYQQSATQAQGGLDSLLAAFAQAGGQPTQAQMQQAQGYAQQVFAPEQNALQNTFQQQEIGNSRLAASLGRSSNDPILRAKMLQEQSRAQGDLSSRQNAYAAQYGQMLPQQAIGAQEALLNYRQNIASQAMQNRLNLLNLGNQLQNSERNWRLQTGTRWGEQASGGGTAGALSGGLAGFGQGLGIANMLGAGNAAQGMQSFDINAGRSYQNVPLNVNGNAWMPSTNSLMNMSDDAIIAQRNSRMGRTGGNGMGW